jgi:hypothetical protein
LAGLKFTRPTGRALPLQRPSAVPDWTLDYGYGGGDNSLTERDIATFTFEIRAKRLQQKNAPADGATAMHEASIDGTSVTINLPALNAHRHDPAALSPILAWLLFAINL